MLLEPSRNVCGRSIDLGGSSAGGGRQNICGVHPEVSKTSGNPPGIDDRDTTQCMPFLDPVIYAEAVVDGFRRKDRVLARSSAAKNRLLTFHNPALPKSAVGLGSQESRELLLFGVRTGSSSERLRRALQTANTRCSHRGVQLWHGVLRACQR